MNAQAFLDATSLYQSIGKVLNFDEIPNLLRELSENESDGGEQSCFKLDSDEEIRVKMTAKNLKSDVIENILENPDIYVAMNGTEWVPYKSNEPGRFATRNVLRQSSGQASFTKHNVNVNFFII
ncbi:hypothetical protein TNCV_3558321 [Trichonephila clavipes]|uniref:Uncharacterized protein n=1 Tax=Trichonephila clavipes TaxID=2585209 RepID=A0A8X6WDC1_TRICX|nr:hypothetical protein TNCV_3558321 [Trichonephila clavipes]